MLLVIYTVLHTVVCSREKMVFILNGTCSLILSVAVMGITTGLLKWLLLDYSELVTEQ